MLETHTWGWYSWTWGRTPGVEWLLNNQIKTKYAAFFNYRIHNFRLYLTHRQYAADSFFDPDQSSFSFAYDDNYYFVISAPYWFYVTITAIIAAIPWIKWRFSLRTLLIVMTLFALFFGAIAMSM